MKSLKNNIYYELFFFERQNLPKGVEDTLDNWLSPLFKELDFHFVLDVSQENEMFILTPKVILENESFNLTDILSTGKYPEIIRNSSIISDLFSKSQMEVDLNQKILLDIKDFLFFNHVLIKRFEKNGIDVILPDELTIEKSAKLSLASDDDFSSKTTLTLDDLDKFDWKVAIGDETFSLNDFELNFDNSFNKNGQLNERYNSNNKMTEYNNCQCDCMTGGNAGDEYENVNYVNDNHGYEAGDQLIIKAASLLLNTQLEKSEILRIDGNEFLVYLVGYSEQQVLTYTKKLSKEMKNLPYGFGAAVGYSMIVDDIKTIEDAINEATLDMRANKEEYK